MLTLLVVLLLLDFLVISLHISRQFAIQGVIGETILANRYLDLSDRLGLRRFLELSTLTVAIVFGILAFVRSREPIYFCGAAVLAMVLAITGFYIHVPLGELIGGLLPTSQFYPASASPVGKAIGLGAAGAALLALLVWGATKSSAGHARLGVLIAATVGLLGLFAVGVDLIQALNYSRSFFLKSALVVVEDGGELFFVSNALMLMAAAARCPGRIAGLP